VVSVPFLLAICPRIAFAELPRRGCRLSLALAWSIASAGPSVCGMARVIAACLQPIAPLPQPQLRRGGKHTVSDLTGRVPSPPACFSAAVSDGYRGEEIRMDAKFLGHAWRFTGTEELRVSNPPGLGPAGLAWRLPGREGACSRIYGRYADRGGAAWPRPAAPPPLTHTRYCGLRCACSGGLRSRA
jgi:hypothetical protein